MDHQKSLRITMLAVLILLGPIPFSPAFAALTSGPYLQNITGSSVELLYEGNVSDSNGLVEFGTSTSYGDSLPAAKRLANEEWYAADITDLSPSTQYFYRLTHETEVAEGWFFTAPAPGEPFSFVLMGDTRTGHTAHQTVINNIISGGYPDLLINTGDMVENGREQWLWQTFFSIEEDLLRHTVFVPAFGNHEGGDVFNPSLFGKYFDSGENNKFWHAFAYGNAYFIIINTEMYLTGEQGVFVTDQLIAARANPDIDFIFAVFHKPGVTTSMGHHPDTDVLLYLLDKFEEYNVDAVFTGHTHSYEHGIVNGVHYIGSGGGGAPLADLISPYTPDGWTIVNRESVYHHCSFSVDAASYTMECEYTDGTVFDTYTATAVDGGVPGPTPQDLLNRATNEWRSPPVASTTGAEYSSSSDVVNYLSMLILPMGTMLLCRRLRRRR